MTRKEMLDFLVGRGFPVTFHTMNKMCAAEGRGPPSIGKFGRANLHSQNDVLKWAMDRLRSPS